MKIIHALKTALSILSRPLPGWVTLCLIFAAAASAAVPLYTGSVVIPSSGSLTNNSTTTTLNSTSTNILSSNTTGSTTAFRLSNSNGTPTSGNMVDVFKGGSLIFEVQNNGSMACTVAGCGLGGPNAFQNLVDALTGGWSFGTALAGKPVSINEGGELEGKIVNAAWYSCSGTDNCASPAPMPPSMSATGVANANTEHTVRGTISVTTGSCGASSICPNNQALVFSNNAVFSSTSSYSCGASDNNENLIPWIVNAASNQAVIDIFNASNLVISTNEPVHYVCTGS